MKKPKFKLGDWNVRCDQCGFKGKASEMVGRWDGLFVHQRHWEPRHELDYFRPRTEDTTVPWVRVDDGRDENLLPYVEDTKVNVDEGLYVLEVYVGME